MQVGLYPPLWTLEHVHQAFRRKFDQDISFDRAFGFSMEGLGSGRHDDPLEQRRKRARNRQLCIDVFRLEALGLSRTAACRHAAAHYVRHAKEELGERQVREIVKSNEAVYSYEKGVIERAAESWTVDERRAFLREFDAAGAVKKG